MWRRIASGTVRPGPAAYFSWAGRTNNLVADWSKHQQQLPWLYSMNRLTDVLKRNRLQDHSINASKNNKKKNNKKIKQTNKQKEREKKCKGFMNRRAS